MTERKEKFTPGPWRANPGDQGGYGRGAYVTINDECGSQTIATLQENAMGKLHVSKQCADRVRHIKRGTEYTVIGVGKVQTDRPLTDYAEVTIYIGDDNQIWVRPIDEFEDPARFERVNANGQ